MRRLAGFGLVVALLLVGSSTTVVGEVSVHPNQGPSVNTLMMSIVEDPDPVNGQSWLPYRPDWSNLLNPDGFERGHDGPRFAFAPGTGFPRVVWAYDQGFHHDIAFSEWDGSGWTDIEFLTGGNEDDLDPTIFIADDGTTLVAWWRDDSFDDVLLAKRPPGSTVWLPATEVTGFLRSGRRPSVVVHDGAIKVVHEENLFGSPTVTLSIEQASGWFLQETLLVAGVAIVNGVETNGFSDPSPPERIDPILHSVHGRLWIDWKNGDREFAHREFTSEGWGDAVSRPWTDPTWLGVEMLRRSIRQEVLSD